MAEEYTVVRITKTSQERLRILAEIQKRSMSNEVEWLIEREWLSLNGVSEDEEVSPTNS